MSLIEFDIDQGPLVVAIAGPEGEGRFAFLRRFTFLTRLPFVSANLLAEANKIGDDEAAALAQRLAEERLASGESFVFGTALADLAGGEVEFLLRATAGGYRVVLCFTGFESGEAAALRTRYAPMLDNLARALRVLPCVLVYDNSGDPAPPVHFVAEYRAGVRTRTGRVVPPWFEALVE